MSAAFIGETDTFPSPGPLELRVLDNDGVCASIFGSEDRPSPEVTIVDRSGETPLVISVSFPTLAQAQRAGAVLRDAFDEVRAIAAELLPAVCSHNDITAQRFSRSFGYVAVCRLCGAFGKLELR